MGPGRRTLRDTSRVLRCCFCLPGRSSVVKQMPLCYNTGTTLTNNRRSHVAPLPELMDRKKRDIMERKGDKEDENKRQKQQKESSAAAL